MNQEMERQEKKAADEDEEDAEDVGSGENLLSLVQPEMVSLSKHWLAALKDHALLSLPAGKLCSGKTGPRPQVGARWVHELFIGPVCDSIVDR